MALFGLLGGKKKSAPKKQVPIKPPPTGAARTIKELLSPVKSRLTKRKPTRTATGRSSSRR